MLRYFRFLRRLGDYRNIRIELAVFVAFFALTLLMTYPWALRLRDSIADTYDSYNFAWLLWWDCHQTFHSPLHLFDANIFYPYKYTLAFGEHNYGIALLFFPLFAFGLPPVTALGVATLTGFALCGYAAFRLARTLGLSNGASWLTGVAFAFAPYRFHQLIHLNYLFTPWLPLILEALILFARRRSWKRAVWLGVAFLMNGLSSTTWFTLALVPLALSGLVLIYAYGSERDPKFWLRGALALLCASVALLPFMLPHLWLAKHYNFVRQPDELTPYTATWGSWLAAEPRNRFWRGLNSSLARAEVALFPGLLPPALTLVGLFLIRFRRREDAARNPNRICGKYVALWLGAIWTVTGFCGSFGLNFFFHRFLFEHLFIFKSMRVPARWAMICALGLSLLAGLGAQCVAELLAPYLQRLISERFRALRARSSSKNRRVFSWRTAIYAALIFALLLEQRVAPLDLERGETKPDELTERLKRIPMRGGLVELPIGAGVRTQLYILHTAYHGHPLITASASFTPPLIGEIDSLIHAPQIPDRLLDLMEATPASYLVVHQGSLSPERRFAFEDFLKHGVQSGRLRFVSSYGEGFRRSDLYAVTKTEPDAPNNAMPPTPLSAADAGEQLREAAAALPQEFQRFGFFVYALNKAMTGRLPDRSAFIESVRRLNSETAGLGDGNAANAASENIKRGFIARKLADENFQREYGAKSDDDFVNSLCRNMGSALAEERKRALIEDLKRKSETRQSVLEKIAEDPLFVWEDCNRAFIMMNYFYYLRRNPNDPPDNNFDGLNFWTNQLDATGDYALLAHFFETSVEAEQAKLNLGGNAWILPHEVARSLKP